MQPYQERVVEEKKELDLKLEKLQVFLQSESFGHIHEAERFRLRLQEVYMRSYSEVLQDRIAAFVLAS